MNVGVDTNIPPGVWPNEVLGRVGDMMSSKPEGALPETSHHSAPLDLMTVVAVPFTHFSRYRCAGELFAYVAAYAIFPSV